ncbi:MAG: hypothetical protein FD173_59 [Gallionellaceae bacterium]|nr:MAG: hypothetical protein FD173_59 [Gallionellaceae bacterium]
MLVLRLLMILLALVIVLSGGMYLFTRQQRYLRFVWQVVRFGVLMLLVFGVLFLLERYVLIGWRMLL